jgi:tRNA A37 threonylcarbamoyladenosine biosynthesis protein TsaE
MCFLVISLDYEWENLCLCLLLLFHKAVSGTTYVSSSCIKQLEDTDISSPTHSLIKQLENTDISSPTHSLIKQLEDTDISSLTHSIIKLL